MWEKILAKAREHWPSAVMRTARKFHVCEWHDCERSIQLGDAYIDPGDGRRYCGFHFLNN